MSNAPEFTPASLEAWAKAAAQSAPGGDVKALDWVTPDGIAAFRSQVNPDKLERATRVWQAADHGEPLVREAF